MNKRRIEESIGYAYDSLKKSKIVEKSEVAEKGKTVYKINNVYRGYISSFGASAVTGNFLAAIAFYSKNVESKEDKKENKKEHRYELVNVIFNVLKKHKKENIQEKTLFEYVRNKYQIQSERNRVKEEILDYAIAVKLAMDLFVIVKDTQKL